MSKKKTPILSNLFFLLKFIWKINKRIYALNIFKVVLDIAQSLTTVIFLRYIVQYIIIDKNWTLTAIFVGALVVSLGITQILSSVIEPILRKDMDLLEKHILTQVGMTAIKMDYFEMEKPFAKDLLQLAQDPGKFVGVLENVIVSISTFVTIIGLAATILAVDKILIVPLLVAIVLILLSEKVKALNWTKWKNLVIPPLRRTNYVLGLLKNPIYGKEVRINAIQEWLYDRAEENCTEYLKTKKKYDLSCRKFSIFSILINFLLFSFLTSFVVYVIYKDIIQIDEAALREKLPLRRADWHSDYLNFAIKAFRLCHAKVKPETQIHTHMCYSEFEDIIPEIDAMDADVITFEASRSKLTILDSLMAHHFETEVGPGVYDIHSPRIPSVEEIEAALRLMLDKIPADHLWVNPDCGLKTRGETETVASLKNMVQAAKNIRNECKGDI